MVHCVIDYIGVYRNEWVYLCTGNENSLNTTNEKPQTRTVQMLGLRWIHVVFFFLVSLCHMSTEWEVIWLEESSITILNSDPTQMKPMFFFQHSEAFELCVTAHKASIVRLQLERRQRYSMSDQRSPSVMLREEGKSKWELPKTQR